MTNSWRSMRRSHTRFATRLERRRNGCQAAGYDCAHLIERSGASVARFRPAAMPWARRRGIHQGEEDLRHGDLERRPQGRQGHVSTQSGALSEQPYGFNTRFEDKPGTNPEEQIGAALASCYAMALSLFLGERSEGRQDRRPRRCLPRAGRRRFLRQDDRPQGLGQDPGRRRGQVPRGRRADQGQCPISKLLKATINLDAKLA